MTENRQVQASNRQEFKRITVVLYSFGFKHGVPVDANFVWDVRFLPNPYWQEDLRPLSGRQEEVADYVVNSEQGREFLELLKPLLLFLIESSMTTGKNPMRLAIGCTGGRHRSVAIVEALHHYLLESDIDLNVFHRDMDREQQS